MILLFGDHRYLLPGIRPCTVAELATRFGTGSPEREVETQELLEFIDWARQEGVERLIVNAYDSRAQRRWLHSDQQEAGGPAGATISDRGPCRPQSDSPCGIPSLV